MTVSLWPHRPLAALVLGLLLASTAWVPLSAQTDPPEPPVAETWRLGTASAASGYYSVGRAVSGIAHDAQVGVEIDVVVTDGSVDNIIRLREGTLDLAVIQNDIGFAAEQGLFPFDQPYDMLRGVMMLYREPVYLVTPADGLDRLRPPFTAPVAVGKRRSGTFVNAKTILQAAGVWDPLSAVYLDDEEAYAAMRDGSIGLAFVNELTPRVRQELDRGDVHFVPLSGRFIQRLRATYPYLSPYPAVTAQDTVMTVAVRSMLVARADLDPGRVAALVAALRQRMDDVAAAFPDTTESYTEPDLVADMPLGEWHEGASVRYEAAHLLDRSWLERNAWALWALPLLTVFMYVLFNTFMFAFGQVGLHFFTPTSSFVRRLRSLNLFLTRRKYILLTLTVLGMFVSILLMIEALEQEWAVQNNALSAFAERPFLDNLLWLFVFGAGGYDGGVFPNNPLGKLLTGLIPIVGLAGAATFVGILTSEKIRDHLMASRGLKKVTLRDHILVCGWSRNVPFLVETLLHKNVDDARPVVVLSEAADSDWVERASLREDVQYVRGNANSRSDLDRANFAEANTAIVIADDGEQNPDALTILKVLTIEAYSEELRAGDETASGDKVNYTRNIYTIAEIKKPENEAVARDAKVDEIISLGEIQAKLFAQSAHNHGVSQFISEILTYDEFNDVYSHPIEAESPFIGRTFDDLVGPMRERWVLLVAIRKGETLNGKSTPAEATGRSLLTNPINAEEASYAIQAGDVLIVLAQKASVLHDAIDHARRVCPPASPRPAVADLSVADRVLRAFGLQRTGSA